MSTAAKLIERGVRVADSPVQDEDKIWSKYSHDKVDIGETLARVIRTLTRTFPLKRPMRALSIGSSNEPQFRILQSVFRGGLYLVDLEKQALEAVRERIRRQGTKNVYPLLEDYNDVFLNPDTAKRFVKQEMGGEKAELITLQHSMYYSPESMWDALIRNLYTKVLAPRGAIYMVLMSAQSQDPSTTTWLYNHYAGKFCGHRNDQDLLAFKRRLKESPLFQSAQIISKSSRVRFFVDDFEKFMAVVWMILLYPQVHRYRREERREITEHIYKDFFSKKRPLCQIQDHVVIYRGLPFPGIV